MNNNLYYYFLLIPFIFYFFITTPYINYTPKEWLYKTLLIYIALLILIISMQMNIDIINTYFLPFLLFLNVAILFYITLSNKFTLINLLPLLGLTYLLFTFDYKEFKINKGLLINPNKKWIYDSIITLCFWYLLTDVNVLSKTGKIINIVLILYPLLFPLNQYFIHRTFSLAFFVSLNLKKFKYIDQFKSYLF
jgi:hypothetical protein